MNYWPGTKIVKSKGNAFDWHGKPSEIMMDSEIQSINRGKLQLIGSKGRENITFVTKSKNYGPKPLGDL